MVSATKTAKRARRLSVAALQEIVGARSAFLPDAEKEAHPERSFACLRCGRSSTGGDT